MIQFKPKYSLQNGNKINRKNWQNIVAISTEPCTNVLGVPEIERQKRENGAYYEKWRLTKESGGYIFREINHGSGISGIHKTVRMAVFRAASFRQINVYLEINDE